MREKMIALGLFCWPVLCMAGPTSEAWMRDPEVVEIRKLYHQFQLEEKSGELEKSQTRLEQGLCPFPTHKAIWTDKRGTVRAYFHTSSSEHSLIKYEIYYDQQEQPRFLFATSHSYYYPGDMVEDLGTTHMEHRIYLNPHGKIIVRNTRLIQKGNAHFVKTDDFIEHVLSEPREMFFNPCS